MAVSEVVPPKVSVVLIGMHELLLVELVGITVTATIISNGNVDSTKLFIIGLQGAFTGLAFGMVTLVHVTVLKLV